MVSLLSIGIWWAFWLTLRKINRPYWSLWYSVLIFAMLWTGIYSWKAYDYQLHPHKEVIRHASMYLGPDIHYVLCGSITAGQRVKILRTQGRWCKIDNDGICGWVPVDSVQ